MRASERSSERKRGIEGDREGSNRKHDLLISDVWREVKRPEKIIVKLSLCILLIRRATNEY